MRTKIVAGNWKMNKDYTAGIELVSEAMNMILDESLSKVKVVFAPPFIHLTGIHHLIKGSNKFFLAGQNCYSEEKGAYTGEISAEMLHSVGAKYVIIGHSERRNYFQEDNEMLARKVNIALKNNLSAIFCIGETLEERNNDKHLEVISLQLSESLYHLTENEMKTIVIAYEPVWAIGTGLTATPEQAQEMHAFIRQEISAKFGNVTADSISIIYGGSCNAQNASALFSQADIDGGLIGGASLKSREFTDIVTALNSL